MGFSQRRDIFLGLATYIAHGTAEADGSFTLSAEGNDIAHYITNQQVTQIVTSNYGDSAVSAWNVEAWSTANQTLLTPEPLQHTQDSPQCGEDGADPTWVCHTGHYDFGALSHLAHWAMVQETVTDSSGTRAALRAKQNNAGKMTLAPENLASTICRVLRAWKGPEACAL